MSITIRKKGFSPRYGEVQLLERKLLLSGVNDCNVLENDTDADGDNLTAVLFSGPQHAAEFVLHEDGSFEYIHDGSDNLVDSFQYRAFDGTGFSNVATVTIEIDVPATPPTNTPPVANDDTAVVVPGNPDPDPDPDPSPVDKDEDGTFPVSNVPTFQAALETDDSGDADDPAIWHHPTNPAESLLLGSDKEGGVRLFDVETGEELFQTDTDSSNNIDVRYGFQLDGESVDLVSASNRDNDHIDVFKVGDDQKSLELVGSIETGITVYGHAQFHDQASGRYFGIVSSQSGEIEQWEFLDNGDGTVRGELVSEFDAGGQVEGIVGDDQLGFVYIGEEGLPLWKYSTTNGVINGNNRTEINTDHVEDDLEGITLYYRRDGLGYLLVSSQGNTEIAVYRREGNNEYLGNFKIAGASGTDGIDVTNQPFGEWSHGVLAIHRGGSTYQVVPWAEIANGFGLAIDTTGYNVRSGVVVTPPNTPPDANDDDTDNNPDPPAPPVMVGEGIFISEHELLAIQAEGDAWEQLLDAAHNNSSADLSDQNHSHNTDTLAKAIVGVRLNDEAMKQSAREEIMSIIETENGGRSLALARNLAAYVIAADIVGLSSSDDAEFRSWLADVRHENLDGRTLISTHEDRPNNWGTHAGASRMAADLYLGDTEDFERAVQVFRGWLGDRSAYAGFDYGDLSWQANPSAPVGINPKGATKNGINIDGVIPDDQRRGGSFPSGIGNTGYPWGALNGIILQAELAYRQGYDVYNWSDQAILRAVTWLYEEANDSAEDEDEAWIPWIVDARYGTNFAGDQSGAANVGKNFGFSDWLYMPTVDDAFTQFPQMALV